MSISSELKYKDEEDFIDNFLIPLLYRLGFSLVVNYHGKREFGKDLIVGEIDRFGHVIYHGLQAKYISSISLAGIEEVITDAKQAFANSFQHPQKGNEERISTFIAINAGSISDEAKTHYFNSLVYPFGGNIRVIDGKDLLALDKLATYNRGAWAGEQLTGLVLEVRINRDVASYLIKQMDAYIHENEPFPLKRLRVNAALGFLERPILQNLTLYSLLQDYWQTATAINEVSESMGASVTGGGFKEGRLDGLRALTNTLSVLAEKLETIINEEIKTLMPLSSI